jgi:hypothetical protein
MSDASDGSEGSDGGDNSDGSDMSDASDGSDRSDGSDNGDQILKVDFFQDESQEFFGAFIGRTVDSMNREGGQEGRFPGR